MVNPEADTSSAGTFFPVAVTRNADDSYLPNANVVVNLTPTHGAFPGCPGTDGDPLQECLPDPSGATMTNGFTVLENHSRGTAIIERVSFYGDQYLQLVDAVVVPIQVGPVGFWEGWPPGPDALSQPGVQWDKRVPAVGARIPPGPAEGGNRNLVIAMWPTAHEGIAAGVQVLYRENGQQYELRAHTQFEVLAAKSC